MTIHEIQALRAELEVALRQAFSDFQTRTGVCVEGIDFEFIDTWHLDTPKHERKVNYVTVKLERL